MSRKKLVAPPPPARPARWRWLVPVAVAGAAVAGVFVVDRSGGANGAPGPAPAGMAWIPGGTFVMGDETSQDQDAPPHEVTVGGFWMDTHEVTNARFAEFVKATGYRTVAERAPTKEQFPDVPAEKLVPFSAVFVPKVCDDPNTCGPIWWEAKTGACWKHPEGTGSGIEGRMDHPVVHIAWEDADAYCKWAGARLPTEAEWEFAARGGLSRKPFVWGDAKQGEGGKYFANTYQGRFPATLEAADGFAGTAPVGSFPANGYGLYDMSGNAWEWCRDWYGRDYYKEGPKRNPTGPLIGDLDPHRRPLKVYRGGSFLCADEYCRRYVPGARNKNPADSGACHTGFRCVTDAR